ncbi:MAG TPA: DUF4153 domain-containing protein [Gemmatimonadales bacterium]|nr:DUF4153 domain-containing protein [Gemmatimonadales bacterium]
MTVVPTLAPRTRLALEIAAAGVAGGIVGDSLLRAMPWGLNVAVGAAALVGTGAWLVRRHQVKHGPDAAWLAITALLLGLAFLRRDAETLAAFDAIALVGTLALVAASLQGELISQWYPFDLIRGVVTASAASIFGGFLLLFSDIQWHELPQDDRLRNVRRTLLGVALAVPALIVFAALFASADPVFNNVLTNLFAFDLKSVVTHTFFIGFWGLLAAGYFRWSFLGHPFFGLTPARKPVQSVVPLGTALGLLNALFLLFVVVQLRYFFGGATLVEETSGLTYAEYARRGFFELMTASGLVLPILLGAEALVHGATAPQLRVFRQLAGLLLGLLAVIMASALQRMRLYVSAFGLSTDRLYATAFMILLLGIFAWFAWTVLRGRRQRFVFGSLMQGLAVLAGLHLLNPDAFIVKTNLHRPAAERPFDAKYALTLGGDAVPALLDAVAQLTAEDRCVVVHGLLARWDTVDVDWRTWNWSRARARSLVRSQADALKASCPAKPQEQHNDH